MSCMGGSGFSERIAPLDMTWPGVRADWRGGRALLHGGRSAAILLDQAHHENRSFVKKQHRNDKGAHGNQVWRRQDRGDDGDQNDRIAPFLAQKGLVNHADMAEQGEETGS